VSELRAVRVVVADDHPIWRSGLRADLGSNFHVIGEAGDADEAIELVRSLDPDLVVCDLHMPGGGGLKVARACGEDTHIVMLTVSEQERDLLDAIAAGANGYLVKSTPPEELRRELWRAAKGEPVFSPALASLVLGEFRRMAKAAGTPTARSARSCSSPRRRSRTTSATSSASSTSTAARSSSATPSSTASSSSEGRGETLPEAIRADRQPLPALGPPGPGGCTLARGSSASSRQATYSSRCRACSRHVSATGSRSSQPVNARASAAAVVMFMSSPPGPAEPSGGGA
jgi:DNA-binding NarL/FixJ family response regulator